MPSWGAASSSRAGACGTRRAWGLPCEAGACCADHMGTPSRAGGCLGEESWVGRAA